MLKSLSLTLVALSSYILSLPVVCNTLMTNEIRVANAVEGEANVLDELLEVPEFREAYLNGDYDADPTVDDFDVLYAVESKYDDSDKYSLYLYVWNKSGKADDVYCFDYSNNQVNLYDEKNLKAVTKNIKFINKSNNSLFIKYCVPNINKSEFFVNDSEERTYSIVELEIGKYNGDLIRSKAYAIGHSWSFKGTGEETLVKYVNEFNYLEIDDLAGGTFRTESSDLDDWTAKNDLFYVYFTVPRHFNETEYKLHSVHADYYQFDLSNKIYALIDDHDADFYNALIDDIFWVGPSMPDLTFAGAYKNQYAGDYSLSYGDYSGSFVGNDGKHHYIAHAILDPFYEDYLANYGYHFRYNPANYVTVYNSHWYFSEGFGYYDWSYYLTSGDLLSGYGNNIALYPIETLSDKVDGYNVGESFDLRRAEMVSGQNRNDVYHDINIYEDQKFDLLQYGDTHSGWSRFWRNFLNGGSWNTDYTDYNLYDIKCVEKIDIEDSSLNDNEFANKYYLSSKDATTIKNKLNNDDQYENGESDLYVVRYNHDYYDAEYVKYGFQDYKNSAQGFPDIQLDAGFRATRFSATVDFDIIDLTFINESEELLNIPVVASPINVFPDVEEPSVLGISRRGCGFWKTMVMILTILALVLLIFLFLKWFIPWKRNRQLIHAVKSSGKSSSKSNTVNHYTYNIKKTYINKSSRKKRKKRRK